MRATEEAIIAQITMILENVKGFLFFASFFVFLAIGVTSFHYCGRPSFMRSAPTSAATRAVKILSTIPSHRFAGLRSSSLMRAVRAVIYAVTCAIYVVICADNSSSFDMIEEYFSSSLADPVSSLFNLPSISEWVS